MIISWRFLVNVTEILYENVPVVLSTTDFMYLHFFQKEKKYHKLLYMSVVSHFVRTVVIQ